MTPEPTDKLDAATIMVGVVKGPEDESSGWHAVDWRAAEANVRRLRQRIFTAAQAGDWQGSAGWSGTRLCCCQLGRFS